MRRHFAVPLALLFIALGVPSNAQNPTDAPSTAASVNVADTSASSSSLNVHYYIVGTAFSLNCTTARPADAGSYVWTKNGTAIEQLWDLRERYKLEEGGAVFKMAVRANEDDFGNYSCSLSSGTPVREWEVRGRPVAKLPANSNVVEKQSTKLTCKILGKPYMSVEWTVSNTTEENGTDVKAVLGDRVTVSKSEQGVENGELVLSNAQRSDAGVYRCTPVGAPEAVSASSTLRVKDQYAALWPFLGICAEVFVLCAIILVYEKRRTKPELDDSDTDNHDQKKS